jgi:hypothetical protein
LGLTDAVAIPPVRQIERRAIIHRREQTLTDGLATGLPCEVSKCLADTSRHNSPPAVIIGIAVAIVIPIFYHRIWI